MAWVRYDDSFHEHPKVTAVIAEDAGAIGLHVLANTWTNGQKRPGFVPAHQPGMLLCDKEQGRAWAALLVRHGLWHDDFGAKCDDCREEYAELPTDVPGYVIHNARDYRAPARDRTTPGTPADLSEKRRLAGRKGGQSSAARREQAKQDAQASQANGVSKTSKLLLGGVSPEPEPEPEEQKFASLTSSSENGSAASDVDDDDIDDEPDTDPKNDRADINLVCQHLADRIVGNGSKRPTIGKRWRDAARLMIDRDKRTVEQIMKAIDWCQDDEFWRGNVLSMPKLRKQYDALRLAAQRRRNANGGGPPVNSGANKHMDSLDRKPTITGVIASQAVAEERAGGAR